MPTDFAPVFEVLRGAVKKHAKPFAVQKDEPDYYVLVTRKPSPFKQHKGEPLFFCGVKTGKAYVSFHLLPLYMNPALLKLVPPTLKKRMQGKACFNFKTVPEKELLRELGDLTAASVKDWKTLGWV